MVNITQPDGIVFLQLNNTLAVILLFIAQDQIGLQGSNGGKINVFRTTDNGFFLTCRLWVDAIAGNADNPITQTEVKQQFSDGRYQRDNALWLIRDGDQVVHLIGKLSGHRGNRNTLFSQWFVVTQQTGQINSSAPAGKN